MPRLTNIAVAGAIAGSGLVGGLIGAAIVGANAAATVVNAAPVAATAPSTTTAPAAPAAGTFRSNEDPTHESGESAAREAAENNGTAGYGTPPAAAPTQ